MTPLSDLAQVVRAALAGFDQHERLLRLHTPLGPQVLLAEQAVITESIGPCEGVVGFRIEMTALSVSAHLELDALMGRAVRLDLLTAASRSRLRSFHGHVTHASVLGSDGGFARYALVIEPWLSLLAHRVDSRCFQGMSVPGIVEQVFAHYQQRGALMPAWRWALADPQSYPERSLCIQYQESDLAFISRLLREEGLFWWFEHEAQADDTLGRHTLVMADHNGALSPVQPERVRYTQTLASVSEDGLHHWMPMRRSHVAQVGLASWDYRSVGLRPVHAQANDACASAHTGWIDVPGVYAYEDSAQGERLARRWLDALSSRAHRVQGHSRARHLHAGGHFVLDGAPWQPPGADPAQRYAVLRVVHRVRNNLAADAQAALERASAAPEAPHYDNDIMALPLSQPVRAAVLDDIEGQVLLQPRPTVVGAQTAVVVAPAQAPVYTDRDHRIKIQFHWQRGSRSSHRLDSDDGRDDAPANEASGTWVRVAESWAGDDWGTNFVPRTGQEVVVQFLDGDIDRPVVVGAVYNGSGHPDAQGNQVGAGAAGATGNAPAWFAGGQGAAGPGPQALHEGHRHAAVLSGYKSQELPHSQDGAGGYNQLVFDDTPGQARIELSSTQAHSQLQLGHLLHQRDNQRLHPRGHGAELRTQAWGAVRAGCGLLLSAYAQSGGSTQAGQQLQAHQAHTQLSQGLQRQHALAHSARQHQAHTDTQPQPQQLINHEAWQATLQELQATASHGAASGTPIGGGQGTVQAWSRPHLLACAPAGLVFTTPAHHLVAAGRSVSVTAGQDLSHTAWGGHRVMAAQGIVGYTAGRAAGAQAAAHTGIRLHAASGPVQSRSASAATHIAARGRIDVASTHAHIHMQAPRHLLLVGAGSALRIEGGHITLSTPGRAQFRASVRSLEGPGDASVPGIEMAAVAPLNLPPQPLQVTLVDPDGGSPANEAIKLRAADGTEHHLNAAGGSAVIPSFKPGLAKLTQTARHD
ncbi:type VI secretion system Vgr family protein [Caldimonas sp.]|uniref:type VI secretion system Vgr family protein n=1 Tax=Caldimonas sp. TaxID=2838790 RepID=UPI00391A190F